MQAHILYKDADRKRMKWREANDAKWEQRNKSKDIAKRVQA